MSSDTSLVLEAWGEYFSDDHVAVVDATTWVWRRMSRNLRFIFILYSLNLSSIYSLKSIIIALNKL